MAACCVGVKVSVLSSRIAVTLPGPLASVGQNVKGSSGRIAALADM